MIARSVTGEQKSLKAASGEKLRGAAVLGAIAWQPREELDLAEWVEQGRRIGAAGRGSGWWIGDWLRYGNQRFGERYSRAARTTGYDVQTLMNMVYVASHVEISRRRENLSWSHHAELAPFSVEEQEHWLGQAEQHKWSVHDMRGEIRRARRVATPGALDAGASMSAAEPSSRVQTVEDASAIICPQCGCEISSVS